MSDELEGTTGKEEEGAEGGGATQGEKKPADDDKAMVPKSRLRGLYKQKSELEQKVRELEEKMETSSMSGMSEVERLKAEKKAIEDKYTKLSATHGSLATKLKRAAVLNHWKDAITPRVADMLDLNKIALDDDGELDDASKALLKEWRSHEDNKVLFTPKGRGGNTPAAGDGGGGMSKDQYVSTLNDPKKTPAERQRAHELYMQTIAKRI